MYEFPKRKSYIYTIPTIKGDFVLKFKQATAEETLEYFELLETLSKWTLDQKIDSIKKLNSYYLSFIKEKSDYKWRNIKKKQRLSLVKRELSSYIDDILQLLHPTRKSIYFETQSPKIDWKKPRNSIFPNDRESIYKKTGIPVDKIYEKLTLEQIGWYIDKIVFEVYETFKEWKAINDKIMFNKVGWLTEEDKKDLEFIKSQKR